MTPLTSSDFSRYEFCPRLPHLTQSLYPSSTPVRDATRTYFTHALSAIFAGHLAHAPLDFLDEAASRGFAYPDGDAYTIANDYSCWLDGMIRIVEEMGIDADPAPLVAIPGANVIIDDAYLDAHDILHLFRISDSADEKWADLFAALLHPTEIQIHAFHLPSVRSGRLPSPLTMAYKHPSIDIYRLAPLSEESKFSSKWKRIGRWEQQFDWNEWRAGIDKDQCMERIVTHSSILPSRTDSELDDIRMDAAVIAAILLHDAPRQRESCHRCLYHRYCHGDEHERSQFTHRDANENLHPLRPAAEALVSLQS